MTEFTPLPGRTEAVLDYASGAFRVIKRGDMVRCAVTGTEIPVDDLRYWNPAVQEAYATPDAMLTRHKQLQGA